MNEITHPPVREALSHLETMYSDEELRLATERRELVLVDAEDALDQARYEGEQKGEKKGHHKGKLEGKQEYGTELLQRLLTHKFCPLSQDLQQRIQLGTPEHHNSGVLRTQRPQKKPNASAVRTQSANETSANRQTRWDFLHGPFRGWQRLKVYIGAIRCVPRWP